MPNLVSIIIPVYNVEKYIEKCVESVIKQTYENLEIILVDDGSTDNSGFLCESFKQKDYRVKVIHKENGGLSSARNCGMKNMTGDLVTFIDSDDMIDLDFIRILEELINDEVDISICDMKVIYDGNIKKDDKNKISVLSKKEMYKLMLNNSKYVSACGKIFKCELFQNIQFPHGEIHEDISTIYKVISKAKKIAYVHQSNYFYLKREDSITSSKFNLRKLDLLKATDQMCEHILNEEPDLQKNCTCCRVHARISISRLIIELDDVHYNDILNECKKFVIKNAKSILLYKNCSIIDKCAIIALLINDDLFKYLWKMYCKVFRGI